MLELQNLGWNPAEIAIAMQHRAWVAMPSDDDLHTKSAEEILFVETESLIQLIDQCKVSKPFIPMEELQASIAEAISLGNLARAMSLSENWESMHRKRLVWDLFSDSTPEGVELFNGAGMYATILMEAGNVVITYFNELGILNTKNAASLDLALEDLLVEGFDSVQPGIMEYLSLQPKWVMNEKASALRMQYTSGRITFDELSIELQNIVDAA